MSTDAIAANEESRLILLEALGPIADLAGEAAADAVMASGEKLHNLAIAPYDYVHSDEYVFAVHQRLLTAKQDWLNGGGDYAELVATALNRIRNSLETGNRL